MWRTGAPGQTPAPPIRYGGSVYDLFLALHLLAAIFAIGPLAHASTTASRGLRTDDASATRSAGRMVRIYSYASVIVVILGFGLMSMEPPWGGDVVADFSEVWIWLSVILWLVAMVIALAVIAPGLTSATSAIDNGRDVSSMVGKIAGSGGVVALLFVAITVLMVYQPG